MIAFLISTTFIFLIDKVICSHITKARWVSLHAIFNFINVLGTQAAISHSLVKPIDLDVDNKSSLQLSSRYSIWPAILTLALHLYHVMFFKLRYEDKIHHLLFIPLLLCNLSYESKNVTLFFACGFPGMISYIALCLKKYGIITHEKTRQIAFYQNLWLRAPGLLFSSFSVFYSHVYAKKLSTSVLITCLLASINGMYYLQQIARKY